MAKPTIINETISLVSSRCSREKKNQFLRRICTAGAAVRESGNVWLSTPFLEKQEIKNKIKNENIMAKKCGQVPHSIRSSSQIASFRVCAIDSATLKIRAVHEAIAKCLTNVLATFSCLRTPWTRFFRRFAWEEERKPCFSTTSCLRTL